MKDTKIGRPTKYRPMYENQVEELLMEIQATAMEGVDAAPSDDPTREMFKRIVKVAFFTQSVNKGLITKRGEFNHHLLTLLGEENLN